MLVKEKITGIGAFELIVERNGFMHPEPGPNMMWNTKYGHMAGFGGMMDRGMMGYGCGSGPHGWGWFGQPNARTQMLAIERARQIVG